MSLIAYLKSFFSGSLAMRVLILLLMVVATVSFLISSFSLFVGITESFQEMAALTILPAIFFGGVYAVTFAILLSLRKNK